MHIHEFQGKELLRKYGACTPDGFACTSPDEAATAAQRIGGTAWVVKAQIHAGDRARAGGVRYARSIDEVRRHAAGLLGMRVQADDGRPGEAVRQLLVEAGTDILREMYVAVAIDRERQRVALLACSERGVDIEEVAARTPGRIHKAFVDAETGLTAEQADEAVRPIGIPEAALPAARECLLALYRAFDASDASLAEIDPLVLTADHRVLALDATFDIDPNALFRHPELAAMHALDEPPDERAYPHEVPGLPPGGDIGCLVSGPGLARATVDLLKAHGGAPGCVLDVGEDATAAQVVEGFAALAARPGLAAILVDVLGERLQCEQAADGIVGTARALPRPLPVVVRMKGANEPQARRLLARSGLPVALAHDLADAASRAVRAAAGK